MVPPRQDLVRVVVHDQEVVVEAPLPILPLEKIRVDPDQNRGQTLGQNLEADRSRGLDLDHKKRTNGFCLYKSQNFGTANNFQNKMKFTTGILIFQNIFFSIYLMDMFFV